MKDGTIGRRYARALTMTLVEGKSGADVEKALSPVEEQLSAIAALFEARGEFREAMLNPSFSPDARKAIIEDVAKAHSFNSETTQFLVLLNAKDRIKFLESIAEAFREEVDERVGRVRANITSAKAIDDGALKDIVSALEKRTGKTVTPEVSVDPELISGISAKIGGLVFDGTVRSQLERMRAGMGA